MPNKRGPTCAKLPDSKRQQRSKKNDRLGTNLLDCHRFTLKTERPPDLFRAKMIAALNYQKKVGRLHRDSQMPAKDISYAKLHEFIDYCNTLGLELSPIFCAHGHVSPS